MYGHSAFFCFWLPDNNLDHNSPLEFRIQVTVDLISNLIRACFIRVKAAVIADTYVIFCKVISQVQGPQVKIFAGIYMECAAVNRITDLFRHDASIALILFREHQVIITVRIYCCHFLFGNHYERQDQIPCTVII